MTNQPKIKNLPLSKLIVDSRVQRPLVERRVTDISSNLNPEAIGVICVSDRGGDVYSIIDGQHRVRALEVAGYTENPITCEVYTGLSLSEEAAMFRLRNNTAQVSYLDKFRVRVIEGDPRANHIMDILTKHGWKLGVSNKDRSQRFLCAISSVEKIYILGDDHEGINFADRTLAIVTKAWGHNAHGVDGRVLQGIGMVLHRYGSDIDVSDLIVKLSKSPGGPMALVGRARGLATLLSTSVSRGMAETIVGIYNRSRRGSQLPAWQTQ